MLLRVPTQSRKSAFCRRSYRPACRWCPAGDEAGVVVRHEIEAVEGGEDRDLEAVQEPEEVVLGPGQADPVPGEQHWAARPREGQGGLAHSLSQGRRLGCDGFRDVRRKRGLVDQSPLDLERNVDPDRPEAAAQGEMQRFLQVQADVTRAPDPLGILGDRSHDLQDARLLIAELPEAELGTAVHRGLLLDLSRDVDRRDGVQPLAEYAGERVRTARAARHLNRSQPPRGSKIPLGSDRAGLLVVVADIAQPRMPADGIVQVHRPPASEEEDVTEATVEEEVRDVVGDAHHLSIPPSARGLPQAFIAALEAPALRLGRGGLGRHRSMTPVSASMEPLLGRF
jgi:hypothetical protein